jgi:hypothetical protein
MGVMVCVRETAAHKGGRMLRRDGNNNPRLYVTLLSFKIAPSKRLREESKATDLRR